MWLDHGKDCEEMLPLNPMRSTAINAHHLTFVVLDKKDNPLKRVGHKTPIKVKSFIHFLLFSCVVHRAQTSQHLKGTQISSYKDVVMMSYLTNGCLYSLPTCNVQNTEWPLLKHPTN